MDEIIDYPRGMPLPIRADKNMTIDTGFRTDQPQVGAPIFQPLTDDLKTVWSVRCSGQLKLATVLEFFRYWFSDSFGGN
ncbi:hypothetical protein AB7V66_20515, partial [Providencia rettgeri]